MTLHISYSAPDFVLQAGDRLLTRKTKDGPTEFDRYSNKSIYLDISDARVVISYTGGAYVSGLNTDVWLAKAIAGDMVMRDYVTQGGTPRRLTLSNVVRQIRTALFEDYYTQSKYDRDNGLTILITGWSVSKVPDGVIPKTISIVITAGRYVTDYLCVSSPFRLNWGSKTVPLSDVKFAAIGTLGDYPAYLAQQYQPLLDDTSKISEAAIRQILVEQIRHVSNLPDVRTVGTEVMLFSLTWDKPPEITFYRDVSFTHPENTVYSPWIINTRLGYSVKPAKIHGIGLELANNSTLDGTVGDWITVTVHPPYAADPDRFELRTQPRKRFDP